MDEGVRADKWLWAARLVKTRGIAAEAIKAGRVEVDGRPIKPSREIRPGDRVALRHGERRIEVVVRVVSARRGPATAAQLLYDETAASRAARETLAEQRRAQPQPAYDSRAGRPTKRDRRRLDDLRGRRA